MTSEKAKITVEASVRAPIEKVWACWTEPEQVMRWNAASDDWHTPRAENDLRVGGTFLSRMEARDGSMGFDFGGTYTEVVPHARIAYTMGDGRNVQVSFKDEGGMIRIIETFEAEEANTLEMQKNGWQAILDRFKKYVEEPSS